MIWIKKVLDRQFQLCDISISKINLHTLVKQVPHVMGKRKQLGKGSC